MKKTDPIFELTKDEKSKSIEALKPYLSERFETPVGNLQADMILDFITAHIGPYFYNKGVLDSMSAMSERVEDLYLLIKDEQ
ncbi:MAG: DUF2164 domain-containing protein [Defluviitaleaceae bacterium]|nr:DUF2164 domain-containing protein [Defluviitaleaceae bacterium]